MMTFLYLFFEFFKIGLFAVGGGPATIPFLQDLARSDYGWFNPEELGVMVAVAESTPGPIGVNMATYAGYNAGFAEFGTVGGILGGITATLGLVTPSVIVIILVAGFLKAFKENDVQTLKFEKLRSINDIQKINDHKNKIETYISKKVNLTGKNSPEGSELRLLTEERDKLEKQLETSVEVISAPKAGLASYRVDGLEDKLKVGDFSYLTSNLLNSFELKVGAAVPLSNEKGKIVDNFYLRFKEGKVIEYDETKKKYSCNDKFYVSKIAIKNKPKTIIPILNKIIKLTNNYKILTNAKYFNNINNTGNIKLAVNGILNITIRLNRRSR